MFAAPAFWSRDGLIAKALSPLSAIGAAMTARRVARPGWVAPVPVICCGNVTVGGAGKTTLVLDLAHRLAGRGVHILLRGYGGSSRGVHRVASTDLASLVGDEALLLAQVAPTWTGADRAASARAAIHAGAKILLMDDGLQNPTLAKTASILVIDGRTGFGNGRVLPAGPLREPVAAAVERCSAAVLIGPDATGAMANLPPDLTVLRASLVQDSSITALVGQPVIAFAGIALPEKFFSPLRQAGAVLLGAWPFPDHHAYTDLELDGLIHHARQRKAILVTTPKDAVRLPQPIRDQVTVVGVGLKWENGREIDQLLEEVIVGTP
ncbi:MAG TPA: tetraacyldisaccharide 4'-kinase [Acetobacteraceae bacterium]|jgi:tetraacyldisaccharide 4'-kinase|nr:tetraacyldisaccharide 4'-kinase [Acetobacteraceae bacterium]